MTKKKEKTKLVWNPDAVAAASIVMSGLKGTVGLGKYLKGKIAPGKEAELAKLKSEVAGIESKKEIEKQIEELKRKKAELESSE